MTRNDRQRGLGRGLSALMAEVQPAEGASNTPERTMAIDRLEPNPDQPRRHFDEEALADLTASIREKGVIQPLVVRPSPRDPAKHEIVAGERRWRAARKAGVLELPVVVRALDDTEVLEIAIIENVQRTDLNPIEEAAGYRQLMDRFGHTQERLSQALGKSRSHIANLLRLLNLPEDVRSLVLEGALSAGHARALVTREDASDLAREVVRRGLSVRETERLVKAGGAVRAAPPKRRPDMEAQAIEAELGAMLGLKVSLERKGAGTGRLVLHFHRHGPTQRSVRASDAAARRLAPLIRRPAAFSGWRRGAADPPA